MDLLYAAGVDEIAINIEIFDRNIASKLMPAKGSIPLYRYFNSLDYAVSLWGKSGNVRSILIVGLEQPETTLAGVSKLVERGVMPILSPFRPIPNTPLAHYPPPAPESMIYIWQKAQDIAENAGMTLGPLCICCQNNTITLPINSKYRLY